MRSTATSVSFVEADDLGLEFAFVGQFDGHLVGIGDDMGVGQDQSVGTDNEAGTHAACGCRSRGGGMPKRRKNSNIGSFGSIAAAVFDKPLTLMLTTAGPTVLDDRGEIGQYHSRPGQGCRGRCRGGERLTGGMTSPPNFA
jgi:hypothetical protein